jgi:hypothetical protein
MKTTLTFSGFRDAFRAYERMDNFSYEGAKALFEYLEQYEEDTGEELELDVIALCCEYTEDTWRSIAANYSIEYDENENDDEGKEAVIEYLSENTQVVAVIGDSILYSVF